MDPAVTSALVAAAVALVSAAVALFSAVASTWSSRKNVESTNENLRAIEQLRAENEKAKTAAQQEKEISKFSEPLARSAYDLQSRLYNILRKGLADFLLTRGNDREKLYFTYNTTFVVAQFLCWTELVRREIQFIDLGESEKTRRLSSLQDAIYNVWGSDKHSALFRMFAGEQRAIGEALIRTGARGLECMGYGAFLKEFPPGANGLIDAVRADVTSMDTRLNDASKRLTRLQHALIDLLDMLDPDYVRFPLTARTKA